MVEVNTDDQKIREYANYPGMYWKYLLSDKEKKAEIRKNYGLFLSVCSKLEYKKAVIIATGPSSGNINHLNFRDALVISCNSKVRDIEFLDKHKPKFICAGDVVSHLGISKYAGQFRADLLRYINDHGGFFVCTLTFGLIFKKHFPEYDNKIILIPQGENGVLFDLKQHFQLPILSSTLNIHMLPIAVCFAKEVLLVGTDGRIPNIDNEDFWAHAESSQYHELVDSGHVCHPTFDKHRQENEYERFINSVNTSIQALQKKALR